MFFFEKKNQKTFVVRVPCKGKNAPARARKSFLLLFFKKEGVSSLCLLDFRPLREQR
jgi:hypothetical protein